MSAIVFKPHVKPVMMESIVRYWKKSCHDANFVITGNIRVIIMATTTDKVDMATQGYPAKRALSAMRKHGAWRVGPFWQDTLELQVFRVGICNGVWSSYL